MEFELTEEQKMYPAIKWLIQDGPRGTGKSRLMALAFLEKGYDNLGQYVDVYDHFPGFQAGNHLLKMVHSLFHELGKPDPYGISIQRGSNRFRIFPIDETGIELKRKRRFEL